MIYLDSREKNIEMISAFKRYTDVEIRTLESGDIVMGDCALEHKSFDDYIQSLHEGRLFNQIEKMVRNFRKCAVVVDCKPRDLLMHKPLRASVASCFARGAPVLFCENNDTLAQFSIELLTKLNDGKDRSSIPSINQRYSKDTQLNIITGIKGISEEKGIALLEHFSSIKAIANASPEQLTQIHGIGEKIATTIYSSFNTPRW